jgi:diaminopimelate decarboxylase
VTFARETLQEIAAAVGTPFYAYDADVFRARIAELKAALGGTSTLVCYSAKANDALALLRIAGEEGLGADIVSGGELFKAQKAGIPAERIVFSGVGKRRDEIRAALEAGVRSINVESPVEIELIADEAGSLGVVAPVSVRLNPGIASGTHDYVATGHAGAKFGLPSGSAGDVLRRAHADPQLVPVGIAFHVGSQLLDPAPIVAALEPASELWRSLASEGVVLRDLDVGGGLGVAYEGEAEPDLESYGTTVTAAAERLGATLVVEPGRWLVAPAGTFVTRVLNVKEADGRRIAVCDGGMNDLIRPSLYGAYHPIVVLAESERPAGPIDVVGPVCESGDFFARGRVLPVPEPGDLVVIGLAGAYGRVMASTYNARPLCAEVLSERGRWRVTREAGTYDDLVRGERA